MRVCECVSVREREKVWAILALPKTYASNYYSGFKILGDDADIPKL